MAGIGVSVKIAQKKNEKNEEEKNSISDRIATHWNGPSSFCVCDGACATSFSSTSLSFSDQRNIEATVKIEAERGTIKRTYRVEGWMKLGETTCPTAS